MNNLDIKMNEPISPTKHERDIRFANMKLMKQQILDIRERKQSIPKVQQPLIVKSFSELYIIKANQIKKKILAKRIEEKQKQYNKIHQELVKYKQKYQEKQRLFKQKEHIFKVLAQKLQIQFEKTKTTFRDVGFNRSITSGAKKLNYYRIGEILFNQNARKVFTAIDNNNQFKSQQQVSICIAYLGLFISIIGQISGARLWFDFIFRGPKSTVRLSDGSFVSLRPKQLRFNEGVVIMVEQLYQIMHDTMGLKVQKSSNLFQLCEELSKNILS